MKMSRKFLESCAVLIACALVMGDTPAASPSDRSTDRNRSSQHDPRTPTARYTLAQANDRPAAHATTTITGSAAALAALNEINLHEIAAAELALERDLSGDAKDFARMLKQAHSDNLKATDALADRTDIPLKRQHGAVRAMAQKHQQQRDVLAGKNADASSMPG